MAGANRLQVRRRGVAAITAAWLVICSVLAVRHEANTSHARDITGAIVHTAALVSAHTSHDADVHSRRPTTEDHGTCGVLDAFHQAASARVSAPALALASLAHIATSSALRASEPAHTAVYRLAPKTSPPA